MKIYHQVNGYLAVNTYYLVNEDNNTAIVIDGGVKAENIIDFSTKKGFKVTHMLLTHGHFDHSACAKNMQSAGVLVGINEVEKDGLSNPKLTLSGLFNIPYQQTSPDFTFKNGEELNINGIKIKVILTAGHSIGSTCFLVDNYLFSGDTLMNETVGRCDFDGGSFSELNESLKKLLLLPDETVVYPGHGEQTTIMHEKLYNPYMAIKN